VWTNVRLDASVSGAICFFYAAGKLTRSALTILILKSHMKLNYVTVSETPSEFKQTTEIHG
jgi:hypothetical protein